MREEKSLGWEAGIAGTNDILDNKSRRLFFSASMSFQSRNYWVIGFYLSRYTNIPADYRTSTA